MRTFRSLNELHERDGHGWKGILEGEGGVKIIDCIFVLTGSDTTDEHRFKEKKSIVLAPQPTDDLNDPLNWTLRKRVSAFITICLFSGLGSWVIGGAGPALVIIMHEFHTDLQTTVNGVLNWSILTLGLGVRQCKCQLICSELLLGSRGSIFRHKAGLPLCGIWPLCYDNMECRR
jgi:hypothetical protein